MVRKNDRKPVYFARLKMDKENHQAVIILHEIYGINAFIREQSQAYQNAGFDVFCPNLIGRVPFTYEESQEAYDYFIQTVGFDIYKEISESISRLKDIYDKVTIVGYSVGAAIAWRCCENVSCDGIAACYGSRIRDYTSLNPACPVLLLFAEEDSFDVGQVVCQLRGKPRLQILAFAAKHGFMDPFSNSYDVEAAKRAEKSIFEFLSKI